MSRSRNALHLLAAALLAASLASAAAAGSITDSKELQRKLLSENDLSTAELFLADTQAQEIVKAADHWAYMALFSHAAELVDLKGVIGGDSTVHSMRQSLSQRLNCKFCLDGVAFPAWIRKNMPGVDEVKLGSLDKVLWNWNRLSRTQKSWVTANKKEAAWPKLQFKERHAVLREWALFERAALLKLNPSDAAGANTFGVRAYEISQVLSSHEMSGVWQRAEQLTEASAALAEARERLSRSNDPRQKALLLQAINAATPEARLSALAALFENYGERPAGLLAAAPPREDQKFDEDSRKLVASMLKTAMLKETEGTFAGEDLKKFYATTPLEVTFTKTEMSALGWYRHGGDTLYFNERYVEEYVKIHGASVADLKRDPVLLQNLARIFASTFVHEAEHHRQDVWRREQKMPRLSHQGDEVAAFQADSLFMMQKMRDDKKFNEWALTEAKTSGVVAGDLANARRMEEQGPAYFERYIPNTHYPERLSKEGAAWCSILWHNHLKGSIDAEHERRKGLTPKQAEALLNGPALKENYDTEAAYVAALRLTSVKSLHEARADAQTAMENSAKHYNQLRARQEAVAATLSERYNGLSSPGASRTERGMYAVPSPVFGPDKETP